MKFKKEFSFAGIFKKISNYFFDCLYVLICTIVFNLVGIKVLEITPNYLNNKSVVNETVNDIYKMESEAKLIDLYDLNNKKVNEPISSDDLFIKYINQHLIKAYNEGSKEIFKNIDEIDLSIYSEASIDNDYLAYFYVTFIPNNLDKGFVIDYSTTPIIYFNNTILNPLRSNYDYFSFNENDFYYLKEEYASDLYSYLYLNSNNETGKVIFENLKEFFIDTLNNSFSLFNNYTPFKEAYEVYNTHFNELVKESVITNTLSYLISFIILMVVIPLVNKDFYTLGELSSKTRLFDYKDRKIKFYQPLIKSIFFFIEIYWVNIVVSVFTIGSIGLSFSLFNIGNFSFTIFYLILISMFILVINIVFGIINKDKRLFEEYISNTILFEYKKVRDIDSIVNKND
ncbi:MAG: RDD family protein [Firmicutes bacterium]|uniref:RDD family protein n=1 Tax=Candidatus Onthovivens merdipullorum TaxID=2840889 RepID=A0A9D9DIF1_9BACL|nr:RDD family protein [Candidatus Onthovivens merdipullorum]